MEREKITIYTMRKVDDQWTVFFNVYNFFFVVLYIHIHTALYFISVIFSVFSGWCRWEQKELSEWLFYITFFYHVGCLFRFYGGNNKNEFDAWLGMATKAHWTQLALIHYQSHFFSLSLFFWINIVIRSFNHCNASWLIDVEFS